MSICESNKCTGCMSCYNICPKNCISMKYDTYGIMKPQINNDTCIHCNLCSSLCPINNKSKVNVPMETYACWSLDNKERKSSSSGGLASIFYAHFIEKKNGTVFGCSYDKNLKLAYSSATNLEDIKKYKGSKYSQSYIGNSYKEIKELLNHNNEVLFIGTPCQVDGLKIYLRKSYTNLTTVDLICHGVPSQKYIDDYIKMLNLEESPDNITFRGLRNFYFTLYKDSKILYSKEDNLDIYFTAFLRGLFYRENCYECKYANTSRVGDITIGDFWGLGEEINFDHNTSNGVSVALINTEKGKSLFENIKNKIFYEKRTLKEAVNGNAQLKHPSVKHSNYENFRNLYKEYGFEHAINQCFKDFDQTLKSKDAITLTKNIKKINNKNIDLETQTEFLQDEVYEKI